LYCCVHRAVFLSNLCFQRYSRDPAIKVLHVITGLGTGGAEAMLTKLLQATRDSSGDCAVVSMMDMGAMGEAIRKLGVPVETLGMRRGVPTPSAIWRLRQVARRYQPDLVQGWMYHGNLAASMAATFAGGRPRVVWNVRHSLYDIRDERPLTRQVIRANARLSHRCAAIVYNSRVSAVQHEAFGFHAERTRILPNGFDLECFRPDSLARAQVRAEFAIPADAPLIGLIGRHHPMKDHAGFLRAAALLAKRYPQAVFLAAGAGVERSNPELSALAASLNLGASRLHLLGERRDVSRLMAALDVLALTSWSEGFPNVVGEAMACAVPCVVTDVGDAAWVVGDTGRVVAPRDPQAFASACGELLELGRDGREALGRAARERIEREFGLDQIASQYRSLYGEVLG